MRPQRSTGGLVSYGEWGDRGNKAICGKHPRLALWCRIRPALPNRPSELGSCGFPEGNNREWQRTQPGLSPRRRGSLQLPNRAGSLTDYPRKTAARPCGHRPQGMSFSRLRRSKAASFPEPISHLVPSRTCIHRLLSAEGGARGSGSCRREAVEWEPVSSTFGWIRYRQQAALCPINYSDAEGVAREVQ
jgi:hypothetical protein